MEELSFVVRTVANSDRDISGLQKVIPNLAVCTDYCHDAMGSFLTAMRYTDGPVVLLEDDVELCKDFMKKLKASIAKYPDMVINYFCMRDFLFKEKKPVVGPGRSFAWNQCTYYPPTYARQIADYYEEWDAKEKAENPTGTDTLVAAWLRHKKLKYVQWYPLLVNHLEGKSLINPKRSTKRSYKNFESI